MSSTAAWICFFFTYLLSFRAAIVYNPEFQEPRQVRAPSRTQRSDIRRTDQ